MHYLITVKPELVVAFIKQNPGLSSQTKKFKEKFGFTRYLHLLPYWANFVLPSSGCLTDLSVVI